MPIVGGVPATIRLATGTPLVDGADGLQDQPVQASATHVVTAPTPRRICIPKIQQEARVLVKLSRYSVSSRDHDGDVRMEVAHWQGI